MIPEPAIHRFSLGNTKLVVDVNSGALHQVDDVTWAVLEYYREKEREEIINRLQGSFPRGAVEEALAELDELCREGLLYSPAPPLPEDLWPGESQVKALCLHVAHDCNLRCRYCFGDTGGYGGDRALMSAEVGRRAVDFLLENSGPRPLCEIDFFGGEPLLNMAVVQEVVRYAREEGAKRGKEFKFTLTTNGVLLDEEARSFLNENNISVVLSIDGRPEIHDRMRTFPGGRGSYHHILPRLQAMAVSRPPEDCVIRGTFTRYNLDFSRDVLHLADLGFSNLSLEPVVAKEGGYALTWEDLPAIFAEYEALAQAYLERHREGRPFSYYHFEVYFNQGPCLYKRISGCGAGHEVLCRCPHGRALSLSPVRGEGRVLLGTVYQGVLKPGLCRQFQEAHVYNKGECASCWARFYCSGGCHANNHLFTGDLLTPYPLGCELSKKRIECALAVQAELAAAGEEQ